MDLHAKGGASLFRFEIGRSDGRQCRWLYSGTSPILDEPSVTSRKWISSTSNLNEEEDPPNEIARYIDLSGHTTINEPHCPGRSDAIRTKVDGSDLRTAG